MTVIYFLYSAMVCIALFGFLHIFFDDRFMNFKTILLIVGFISFLIAMFIFNIIFCVCFNLFKSVWIKNDGSAAI